jgi:hypothetical protein
MLNSRTPRWEDLKASPLLSSKDLIERLDYKAQGPLSEFKCIFLLLLILRLTV